MYVGMMMVSEPAAHTPATVATPATDFNRTCLSAACSSPALRR